MNVSPGLDVIFTRIWSERTRTPEDAKRDCPEYSPLRFDDHLSAGGRHLATIRYLLERLANDFRARFAPRLSDPDNHRRIAFGDWYCGHGPTYSTQRSRDVRPCS